MRNGEGINTGTITLDGTGEKSSVALFSAGHPDGTVSVTNSGHINVSGNAVGITTEAVGVQKVVNTGEITATGDKSMAIQLVGDDTTLDNQGILRADNTALFLEHMGEGKVTNTGTFELSAEDAIGVYADSSVVDFPVHVKGINNTKHVTAVYAKDDSVLRAPVVVDADNSIGVFANSQRVHFEKGFTIGAHKKSIGLYLNNWKGDTVLINPSRVDASTGSVGIYVKGDKDEPVILRVGATINVEDDQSVGIFANDYATIRSHDMTMNINGGTGVYGTGDVFLGTEETEPFTVNFGENGGVVVNTTGKSVSIGKYATINGNGTFVRGTNLNVDIDALAKPITVTENNVGIAIEYNKDRKADQKIVSKTDFILEGDQSIAISGVYTALDDSKDASIDHEGSIQARGTNNIGIYSKGLDVRSKAIAMNDTGIGIYMNQDGLDTANSFSNKEMTLGTHGIGIYLQAIKVKDGDNTVGSIMAPADKNNILGLYAKHITGDDVTFKDASIELQGENNRAIVFEDGAGHFAIDGTSLAVGAKSIALYAKNSQEISAKNLAITLGDRSSGIYANHSTITMDMSNSSIVGKENADVVLVRAENDATVHLNKGGNLDVNKGIGVYAENSTVDADMPVTISVHAPGSVGISADSSTIGNKLTISVDSADAIATRLHGAMQSAPKVTVLHGENAIGYLVDDVTNDITLDTSELMIDANAINKQGIVTMENTGNGSTITTKGATVMGKKSIAVYNVGNYKIHNEGDFVVESTEEGDLNSPLMAIYSTSGDISSVGATTIGENSVGYYVADHNVSVSGGPMTVAAGGAGIYTLSKEGDAHNVESQGDMTVAADKAVGIYAENNNVNHSGNIIVGANKSFGIYAENSDSVMVNADKMSNGTGSVTLYLDKVKMTDVTGKSLNVADKSYGVVLNDLPDSVATLNIDDMQVGKESVGIYHNGGTLNYTGDITVAETTIAPNIKNNIYTVGIYAHNRANVNYNGGNLTVDKPLSIGIYGKTGATITVGSKATFTVKNGGKGIIGDKGVKRIVNNGVMNVDGKYDKLNEPSTAITAYDGVIENNGTINVTNGGVGIYTFGNAKISNKGTITVDASSTATKRPTMETPAEIGSLTVDKDGVVTIDKRVINGGTIDIKNGTANLDGMAIDVSNGKVLVTADQIKGLAEVTPEFTQGNNARKMVIKSVFVPKNKGIGEFFGAVKSQSITWIAKVTSHLNKETDENEYDLTMAKVPYKELLTGTVAPTLSVGMDELYVKRGVNTNDGKIFDRFDTYKDPEKLARSTVEFRGDPYANIQERMQTVKKAFNMAYKQHDDHYNYTKNTNDFNAFFTRDNHVDNSIGISGYHANTWGLLYEKEKERKGFKTQWNYSLGVAQSKFDFTSAVNNGSTEKVNSLVAGIGVRHTLNKSLKDDRHVEFKSDLKFIYNKHNTNRKIHVDENTYTDHARFNTYDTTWENTFLFTRYKDGNKSVTPYVGLDFSYGAVPHFAETGDAMLLDIHKNHYFMATPKVGLSYKKYTVNKDNMHRHYVQVDAGIGYHIGHLYNEPNRAKLVDTTTAYYNLNKPYQSRFYYDLGLTLGYEKANYGGFEFTMQYSSNQNFTYRATLNRKF